MSEFLQTKTARWSKHELWNQTCELGDLAINLPYLWREEIRYHFTPVKITSIKKDEIANVREDVEKREPLCTTGGIVNWRIHNEKQYGGFSKS